jgi:hypothetical protein
MRTVLCVLLLCSPAWGQSLLWEQSNLFTGNSQQIISAMNFKFGVGVFNSDWDLTATQSDVGQTFHIPASLLPIHNQALTVPSPFAVFYCCSQSSSHPHQSPIPNLDHFRITDVTQTIDEFSVTRRDDVWAIRAAHTVRLYGAEIPPLPGDFNWDGFVDGADYTHWRNTPIFGEMPNGSNGLFAVEGDYTLWRANFGRAAFGSGLASAAIPEPSTIALLLFTHCLRLRRPRRNFGPRGFVCRSLE